MSRNDEKLNKKLAQHRSEQEMQAAQHRFLERRKWWLADTTRDDRLERE
jgi:hypothetical protein